MRIKGTKVTITSVDIYDARYYYKYFNEEVTRYQFAEPFKSLKDTKDFINNFIELSRDGICIMLSLWHENEEFIGSVEIYGLEREYPEIGIWISEEKRNRGYAYETLKLLKDFFVMNTQVKGFIYEADIRNESSLSLIEKLNGVKIGFDIVEDGGKVLHLESYIF